MPYDEQGRQVCDFCKKSDLTCESEPSVVNAERNNFLCKTCSREQADRVNKWLAEYFAEEDKQELYSDFHCDFCGEHIVDNNHTFNMIAHYTDCERCRKMVLCWECADLQSKQIRKVIDKSMKEHNNA